NLAAWLSRVARLRAAFVSPGEIRAAGISPDGNVVLVGAADGTAWLWDVGKERQLGPVLRHDGPVVLVAFAPAGKTALPATADGTARLWDVNTGKQVGRPLRHDGPLTAVAFSRDGRYVATGEEGKARLWDAATGKMLTPVLKCEGVVAAVAFAADGATVLTGSITRTSKQRDDRPREADPSCAVQRWDVTTGEPFVVGPFL